MSKTIKHIYYTTEGQRIELMLGMEREGATVTVELIKILNEFEKAEDKYESIENYHVIRHLEKGGRDDGDSVEDKNIDLADYSTDPLRTLVDAESNGRQFLVKTIIPTLLTLFYLWLTAPLHTIDPHIAISIFGGALVVGIGVGWVMAVGGSTADTETIALALHKKFNTPIPPTMKIIDVCVILCGLFVYGWQTALFSVGVAIAMSETVKLTMKAMAKR